MPEKSITASILWDRFGLGVSTVCAIHCLVFPVIISILPLWSFAPVLHEWAHPVFLIFLIPIVFFASRRSHFDKKITSLLVTGFFCVLAAWALGHLWFGIYFETIGTLFGSVLLIAGHWMNYRHHQTCKNSSHKHHPVLEESSQNLS